MEEQRASRTAEAAAATRAYYHRYRPPVIFADPYAQEFLRGFWRLLLATPLCRLVFEKGLKPLKPVGGQVVARSRYAEDKLTKAIARGVDQYVIVGAGYDSFSLRNQAADARLTVFEVDHPATQSEKRRRIEAITGGTVPANLRFVPVDFEVESLADGMTRGDFDPSRPAFFSWLGTTPYLTNEATTDSLAAMSALGAHGSELVFDFLGQSSDLQEPEHRALYRALMQFTEKRGEPIIGEFPVDDLTARIASSGWELLELTGFEEQQALYFGDRPDDAMPMPGSFLAHLARSDPAN